MESTVLTQTLKRKRRRPWSSRKIDLMPKGVDRLSILPDELLSHILSFLPTTNDAIRTSILATRWKYLWTCVPNHNFQYDPRCAWRGSRAKYRSFTNSVDRMFLLCDPGLGIDKFRILSTYKTDDNPNLGEWASFLISRSIKEFHLQLSNSLVCQFPSSLLTCQTLVVLQLVGKFKLNLPTSVSLPNLKTLCLNSDQYSSNKTVSSLLSGCPVLEVLSMTRLTSDDNDDEMVLNISAPSLKTLLLDFNPCKPSLNDDDDDDVQEMYDYGTIIDAPNLEYLTIYDYGSAYISLTYMPSLVEADIDVRLLEEIPPESEGIATNVMGVLLSAISNAQCLSLHGNATQSLFGSYDLHLPKFSKLERLAIGIAGSCRLELLPNLLESMPKLQGLVFLKGLADSPPIKFNWSPPEDPPLCLRFHLKTIEIHNFYGGEDELKLVKYMLEKAKVLEKMTICPCTNSQNFVKDISRDKLLKSPLGSRACQINFII